MTIRAFASHRWPATCVSGMPLIASGFVLGQALLAALWMLLALGGWFRLPVVAGVSLLLFVAGLPLLLPLIRAKLRDFSSWVQWLAAEHILLRIIAFSLLLLVLGFGWTAWVMPPFGDAEAFYITYARIIAAAEKLEPMQGEYASFSSIGLMGELHFAALIKLASVPAAKLFVWLLGLAAATLLTAISGVAGVKRIGQLLVWVLLFTSTTFTNFLFDGKVDLFAATLGLAAVFWILVSTGNGLRGLALAIGGLCSGFAVVAKFSYALGFVPAIAALIAMREMAGDKGSPGKMRNAALPIMVFGFWAVLAVVPHLIKNAVLFDTPLAPFIGGGGDQNWLQQAWVTPDVTRRIMLTYPFALVFAQYPMQGGNLSLLWLALLPFAWLLPRPMYWSKSVVTQLCTAGAVGIVMWMIFRSSVFAPRYLLTTLLLFYPLAVKAAEQAITNETGFRWLGGSIVIIALLALWGSAQYPIRIIEDSAIRGLDRPCAFASTYCEPLSRLSREAEAGDRVYFAGFYSYWLRDDLLQCISQGNNELKPTLSWELLFDGGFQWLVLEKASRAETWAKLSAMPKPDGLRVQTTWDDKDMLILKLESTQQPPVVCRQTAPPAWAPVRIGSE